MEYGRKNENHGKCEKSTLQFEKWRDHWKKREKLEMHTVGPGIWQENWKSGKWEKHF